MLKNAIVHSYIVRISVFHNACYSFLPTLELKFFASLDLSVVLTGPPMEEEGTFSTVDGPAGFIVIVRVFSNYKNFTGFAFRHYMHTHYI